MNYLDILAGYKTYISACGLIGLAVYDISINDYVGAFQSAMAALAAFGVRTAMERHHKELKEAISKKKH